jgi:sugar transferase (PEP-CTERM system associated)
MTVSLVIFLLDCLFIVIAWPVALWAAVPGLRFSLEQPALFIILLYPLLDLIMLYAMGLYRRDVLLKTRNSLRRIPLVVGVSMVAATASAVLLQRIFGPFSVSKTILDATYLAPSVLFAAGAVCFTACGVMARLVFPLLRRHEFLRPRLLVVGAGRRAWDLLWLLRSEGRNLHYDVTFIHSNTFGTIDPRLAESHAHRIIQSNGSLLDIAKGSRADQIVVAPDERRGMTLHDLIACKTAGYPVLQYMTFLETEIKRIDVKRLDVSWLLYSDGFSFNMLDRTLKRAFDIVVSLLLLILCSPFLLLGMLAIWLQDRGPVFYAQTRITRNMRQFRILKLRTMRINAEAQGAVWAAEADNRITAIGQFLRRTRLDEIPQLYNVLKGDMSLVGPRPERPEFTHKLAEQLPLYNERHMVKTGLTGWAQINYPYGASLDDARSKLSYDLYYVKNFSILLDFLIILQTLRVVLWPSGVR